MARRVAHDDTGVFMRQPLVVIVWLLATACVVYVANTAVELVDLQVFPEGASIRVQTEYWLLNGQSKAPRASGSGFGRTEAATAIKQHKTISDVVANSA